MGALRKLIVASALFALMAVPVSSFAGELAVYYAVLTSQSEGEMVRGTMRVTVLNATDGELQNVDLRLAQPGLNSIDQGVYQFGGIPGSEARVVFGDFLFAEQFLASGTPVIWRIDYDDALGTHKQTVVPGLQEDGGAQQ